MEDARETRRIVTVLFADLVGSTGIAEQLDPEVFRAIQTRMFAALRETIERHGGTVEKFIGDAVMAVFGLPVGHEDDALRAVRTAAQFESALEPLNRELTGRRGLRLELRVGINTGEVVASEGATLGALVTGDVVNVAARLQQQAAPGDVLLGPITFRLVEGSISAERVDDITLRGRSMTLSAHRLRSLSAADERPQRSTARLVARDRELGHLVAEFDRVRTTQTCRLVTIVAPAGVGKSRLVREFQARVAHEATVLRGRCLSYGEGITFWPIAQIVRQAIGAPALDAGGDLRGRLETMLEGAPRAPDLATVLAAILGQDGVVGSAEEIGWAIRGALSHLARERPLVVVVEDIHWAEPGLLDVLEAIVDWGHDAPILILCPARPEVLDTRPTLAAPRDSASVLRLAPLAAADAAALIAALPGGTVLPGALRWRIENVAEGNPLFIEEMLGMLIDDGRLRREGEDWVAAPGLETLPVPASVRALIAARVDALATGERRVAERASVVGREFERSAVASLTTTEEREPLAARLLNLTRKELIEPTEPGLGGADAFRFRHILIRDAAYERLPKRERAILHARLADWLAGIADEGGGDILEIVGYHLAEAVRYRTEMDMDRDPALVARAIATLSAAANRAENNHRSADAADLHLRMLAILGESGDDHDAIVAADAARRKAAEAAHLAGMADRAIAVMSDVISRVDPVADRAAAGSAYERLGTYLLGADRPDDAREAYRRSLEILRDPSAARARTLASLGRLEMLMDHDDDAEMTLREALEIPGVPRSVSASAMTSLGTILNHSGVWLEGVEWIRRGLEAARSTDDGFELFRAYNNLAGALERMGEIAASVATFEQAYAEMTERQMTSNAPLLLANWSFNLLLMGRVEEAETLARQALDLGPVPSFVSNVWDRLGWALLVGGRIDDASDAYRQARAWAERNPRTDLQLSRFERHMGFGRVLAATGAFDGADAEFRKALPDGLTGFPLAALPDLVAEATGNRATQAEGLRRRGDLAGAADAAASAERWKRELDALWPSDVEPSPRIRPFFAIVDAEVGRAAGRSEPDAWARVIELARPHELRLAEVYARFRYAEALAIYEGRSDDVIDAVGAALHQSRELGTGLYTGQIEALADRLDVSEDLKLRRSP